MYSVHIGKMYKYNYLENVHVQLSRKMYKYNHPAKCSSTIIRESVHVQLSLLGLSGNPIGNRISLNAIPNTLYSIVTNSHRLTTVTSFDTEARKDRSLPPPPHCERSMVNITGPLPIRRVDSLIISNQPNHQLQSKAKV
jgi:hypothetical protein